MIRPIVSRATTEASRPARRRRTWWLVYGGLVLVFASFAGWSTATVLEVSRLRDEVEVNVGVLVELQAVNLELGRSTGYVVDDATRAQAAKVASSVVARFPRDHPASVAARELAAVGTGRSTMAAAIDRLVYELRADNGRVSERVGKHWDSMGVIVAVSLALAMGVIVLVELIRRRAGKLAAVSAELAGQLARRRHTLEQLEASRQRFALAAAASHDGVWDWNLETGRLWISEQCAALFGVEAGECEHPAAVWFDRIDEDDRPRVQAAVDDHVAGRTSILDVDYRIRADADTTRWISTRGLAVREEGELAHRVVGSHSDVTQTREMERLKNQFVAAISHELRTPLTAIMGALALAVDGRAGELSPDLDHLLRLARRNGDRLLQLVNDILDSQRLAERRVSYMTEDLDLVPLCARTLEECQGFATPANVELRFEAAVDHAWVETDPARVAQVVTNLVSNAVKFSPPEGVVALRVDKRNGRARVEVRDRGPGIPNDELDRIFERFVKASSKATQNKPGAGLGLTISKAIIEALGGQIGVRSDPGVGATFYFELPLSTSDGRARATNEGTNSAAVQAH